jgi:hypothetical protein
MSHKKLKVIKCPILQFGKMSFGQMSEKALVTGFVIINDNKMTRINMAHK